MTHQFLNSDDTLTSDLLEAGVVTWDDIVRSVQCFHYGRNSKRDDISLVWYERKGTCSSKHAFLKQIATLNKVPDVKLILAYYKMNETNTPGIGYVLNKYEIESIPEAHCYLEVNGKELDITTVKSSFSRYSNQIIETKEIEPEDIIANKIIWHKEFLHNWLVSNGSEMSLDELWSIREECIEQLENQR